MILNVTHVENNNKPLHLSFCRSHCESQCEQQSLKNAKKSNVRACNKLKPASTSFVSYNL